MAARMQQPGGRPGAGARFAQFKLVLLGMLIVSILVEFSDSNGLANMRCTGESAVGKVCRYKCSIIRNSDDDDSDKHGH